MMKVTVIQEETSAYRFSLYCPDVGMMMEMMMEISL